MKTWLRRLVLGLGVLGSGVQVEAWGQVAVPEPLRPWQEWVLWGEKGRDNPPRFNDASKRLGPWLSRVELDLNDSGGRFQVAVMVFEAGWVTLPGSAEAWPQEVKANGVAVPVLRREGRPAIRLQKGTWRVEGRFLWVELPPRVSLPPQAGVLALTVGGRAIPAATWDGQGSLMLGAVRGPEPEGEAERDFLSKQVYRLIEDGVPMWLRTEIELTVSGKSREEILGNALPEGWTLAQVNSPLPVAVDESGNVRAQVRAGRWSMKLDAFRLRPLDRFGYAAGVTPMVSQELIAFRAKPDFRLLEIVGIPAVDVSQTTMPARWREFPVYQWETSIPFQMEERMRGMGLQRPERLRVERKLWLDEDGQAFTFHDRVLGQMQEIWRLDAAEGQELGSVRMDGEGLLITRNPITGASGVEIRTRQVNVEATGRAFRAVAMSASGWRADAEQVRVDMELPPGWRLFAVVGADWVKGDWLTAWTLLDLFVLLVFSVAVGKGWGVGAGVLAFVAFGLSYHEPEAPRYAWLFLLAPLALLRVVPRGWLRRVVLMWMWVALAVLVVGAIPFVISQMTAGLYPQLEQRDGEIGGSWASGGEADGLEELRRSDVAPEPANEYALPSVLRLESQAASAKGEGGRKKVSDNMAQQVEARIQTGPGLPEWNWRNVGYGWNGPVTAEQEVRPLLVPAGVGRTLCFLRVLFVLALVAVLLELKRDRVAGWVLPQRGAGALAALLFLLTWAAPSRAQFPDSQLLEQLKTRLLQVPDAFPEAASIAEVSIELRENRLVIESEIHAAVACAVPLPGRLPSWSPVSIRMAGRPEAAVRRDDGFLWVAVPEGVSRVQVEGLVVDRTEWECAFLLKPARVTVDAPGWTVTGLKPSGEPEEQIFFSRRGRRGEEGVVPTGTGASSVGRKVGGEATFDQRDYAAVVLVNRTLELGLVWKVRTEVQRLSALGKAVSLRIPLVPGENVLSSNLVIQGGLVEVRLGAMDKRVSWESELAQTERIELTTTPEDAWVERWTLMLSPVWNVSLKGLPPMFEPGNPELVPVWHPWPGESVELEIGRPEAVEGATLTVQRVSVGTDLGRRQRSSTLSLSLQCSVGQDMAIRLPEGAEVSSLNVAGQLVPVRMDGGKVILPIRPGMSEASLGWRENCVLGLETRGDRITLPVESANVSMNLRMPDDRWVLWTGGPQQGPAVRFWVVLLCAALLAYILGGRTLSPLRGWEWMLLSLGLTQVSLGAAAVVIAWFFLLAWRGQNQWSTWAPWAFNLGQVILVVLTIVMLGAVLTVVGAGLLGQPEMFIAGNGSTRTGLSWFAPRTGITLPEPVVISVSIWWYRLLMLAWALWLAFSLIRWLKWALAQFSAGGWSRRWSQDEPNRTTPPENTPPPLPKTEV
ncbi:MAG: hypothetical protein OHK005_10330 [Candidatus Methylacidiphilales bacterium]